MLGHGAVSPQYGSAHWGTQQERFFTVFLNQQKIFHDLSLIITIVKENYSISRTKSPVKQTLVTLTFGFSKNTKITSKNVSIIFPRLKKLKPINKPPIFEIKSVSVVLATSVIVVNFKSS